MYFGEHISGQLNSNVPHGHPGILPLGSLGETRTQVWQYLGWLDAWILSSLQGPTQKDWKGNEDTCPELGAPFYTPYPHRDTTRGFSPTTHEHPPRPLQQVSAEHTSLPIWFQEPKIHRKTTVGQEESKFKPQSQGLKSIPCLLMAPPASAGIAGNIRVSKAGEKAQHDYIYL